MGCGGRSCRECTCRCQRWRSDDDEWLVLYVLLLGQGVSMKEELQCAGTQANDA